MKGITMLTMLVLAGGGDDKEKPRLELRIKAHVAVRGLDVTIGELCELKQTDAPALAVAGIKFGPAPVNGYTRTISRTEIVQALAGAGVDLDTLSIVGSTEAVVQGVTVEVPGHEILDAAMTALQAQLSVEGGDVEYEAPVLRHVQAPPGRRSQDLRARVRGSRTGPDSATVEVDILVDGQSHRKVPVQFRLQRYQTILKTVGAIRAGEPLGADNVALVREPLAQAGIFLERFDQIESLIAARNLQGSQRLTLGDTAPPSVIKKGDIVTVVLTRGRVKVTAKAMASHDAPMAGRVTLINTQTRATLTGIVQAAGLVVVPQ